MANDADDSTHPNVRSLRASQLILRELRRAFGGSRSAHNSVGDDGVPFALSFFLFGNYGFVSVAAFCEPRLGILTPQMLQESLEQGRALTDAALDRLIPLETQHPESVHKAMRHSVFAGGKRLRPVLCMEAGRMIAGSLPKKIEELGAALEMLHTYSLIHDDLPALDNDDLRRGRPTCHKVFGEALAILAGDALQTQAYEVLAQLECPAEARVRIIEEIARGTGTRDGMIGGQVVDLEAEHTQPTAEMLEYIHRAKTAALITASLVSGGLYAGAKDSEVKKLRAFGQSIGLAFQIVDDVLDVTQTSEQLGKTAGKDTAAQKATYPALFGVEESVRKADLLVSAAFKELDSFGERAEPLRELARYLVERKK
jgi:geranylgeranyl diphosphate synthase type II